MFEELNARFKYKPSLSGPWRVMTNDTGSLMGNSADYALTALWHLSEKSWLTFVINLVVMRYVLIYCTLYGTPHVILYDPYRGCFIDNMKKRWITKRPSGYRFKFPYFFPLNIVVLIGKGLIHKLS
jgi:hypothetical protein